MEKAQIYYISGTSKELLMDVMFNPNTYTMVSGADYEELRVVNNVLIPSGKFKKLKARTLSLDLYFDTLNGGSFDFLEDAAAAIAFGSKSKDLLSSLGKKDFGKKKDITQYTEKLDSLLSTNNDRKQPPITIFSWGGFTFTGVVTRLTQKNTMFLSNGIPVRTTVTINITEYENDKSTAKNASVSANAKSALESAASIDIAPVAATVLRTLSFVAGAAN